MPDYGTNSREAFTASAEADNGRRVAGEDILEQLAERKMTKKERREAIDRKTAQLQAEFSYEGYQVVRKELFAHLREPAMTIRKDSITFNTACIDGLEDVVYVNIMYNPDVRKLIVQKCDENDKDALRWCISKPNKRKSRKMLCKRLSDRLYEELGWNAGCRYKILGYRIKFEGETLYIFDLLETEIFVEGAKKKKKGAVDTDNALAEATGGTKAFAPQTSSCEGFFSGDLMNTYGVSVEEHRKALEVEEKDGFVSMAALTGKR